MQPIDIAFNQMDLFKGDLLTTLARIIPLAVTVVASVGVVYMGLNMFTTLVFGKTLSSLMFPQYMNGYEAGVEAQAAMADPQDDYHSPMNDTMHATAFMPYNDNFTVPERFLDDKGGLNDWGNFEMDEALKASHSELNSGKDN